MLSKLIYIPQRVYKYTTAIIICCISTHLVNNPFNTKKINNTNINMASYLSPAESIRNFIRRIR